MFQKKKKKENLRHPGPNYKSKILRYAQIVI